MANSREQLDKLRTVGSLYLQDYARQHGKAIYEFMARHGVGESDYGRLMDALGRSEACHRLYGHNLIYDFPFERPEAIWDFVGHELSDVFTKQGLPIVPGELLQHTGLLKYCKSLSHNWNFVNGFDLLAGTVAIYGGGHLLKMAIAQEVSTDSFADFAKQFGVGGLELALALSSCNPFLLLGAALQLTGSVRGLLNDSAVILFRRFQDRLTVEFALEESDPMGELNAMSVDAALETESVDRALDEVTVERDLERD